MPFGVSAAKSNWALAVWLAGLPAALGLAWWTDQPWAWGTVVALCLIGAYLQVVNARDLHRQRLEAGRLQRLAELRADRVSMLSHEIRTPLAMVKGAADLLLEGSPGPLTTPQHTFLETISQNSERTISLAEDLLTQARIEAGLFRLRIQPTDLKVLTRQVARGMRPIVATKEQTIHVHAPQILSAAQADGAAYQQVLTNLLHNASRHTTRGGQIYVVLAQTDSALTISVTDDGFGMTLEDRRRLFHKFVSGRPLGDGTGLGLVISQQLIEQHGGRILVDTQLGQGTTFMFTLPIWRDASRNTIDD